MPVGRTALKRLSTCVRAGKAVKVLLVALRRRRLHSRQKWERMDSALAYSAQEVGERSRGQSLPQDVKSPQEALAGVEDGPQNLSSIYLATESAPASPFGSMTQVGILPIIYSNWQWKRLSAHCPVHALHIGSSSSYTLRLTGSTEIATTASRCQDVSRSGFLLFGIVKSSGREPCA